MTGRALFALVLLVGCGGDDAHPHEADHTHEDKHGHRHGHGHGDGPTVGITRWDDGLELFAEHPPAVVGQPMPFLAHLTVLDGFRALDDARVRLVLEGPATVSAEAGMLRSGIYRPQITPPTPGTYAARLEVIDGGEGTVDGFEIVVHPDASAAAESVADDEGEGDGVSFLKEQQWRVPFDTAWAERDALHPTVEVPGEIAAPPGGAAHVHAPVAGRVMAGRRGFPSPGQRVEAGDELATLAPTPGSPEQSTRAELDVVQAEARLEEARAELARMERLLADQAVPARRVEEARRATRVAEAAVSAARRARSMYAAVSRGRGRGTWRITAPIGGVIDRVESAPGEAVATNEPLFSIIDPQERWLTARVPEAWASRVRPEAGVRFRLVGEDTSRPVDGALVDVARAVDERSRTVRAIWSLPEPAPALRVGAAVRVAIPVGDPVEAVVVPRSALVDVEGRQMVYVQVEGELFEERAVRTGPSDGDRVAIVEGVEGGERVVTRGGYLVRLASRGGETAGHGHVH